MKTHSHTIRAPRYSTVTDNVVDAKVTLPGPPWAVTDRSETDPTLPTIRGKRRAVRKPVIHREACVMDAREALVQHFVEAGL